MVNHNDKPVGFTDMKLLAEPLSRTICSGINMSNKKTRLKCKQVV